MMKFILRLILVISLSLNLALAIYFLLGERDTPEDSLKLSPEQKSIFLGIRERASQANQKIQKKIKQCHTHLFEALNQKKVDREELYECIAKISDLQREVQKNTVDEILAMKQHLSRKQCDCLLKGLQANLVN